VWGWYEWRRMRALDAEPNPGHHALADLQRRLGGVTIITQNVDDLHERAGAAPVIHLHGSIHAPRCEKCSKPHPISPPQEPEEGRRLAPPRCLACGGLVRPGVVWFGEALPVEAWERAEHAVRECEVFLSVGTSGVVEPAASLARYARRQGATTAQVNTEDTGLGSAFEHDLRGSASEILPALVAAL
jgi:NAD-dependent deacetylase